MSGLRVFVCCAGLPGRCSVLPAAAPAARRATLMADNFRLYDLVDSPFCLKVRICLHLKRVPYRRIPLTLGRLRELRRVNPLGKVPVLIGNGQIIPDSSQIARYLDERFATPPLLPKDQAGRAYCHLIEEWADESFAPIVGAFKWLNPANRAAAYANTAEMVAGPLPARPALFAIRLAMSRRYATWHYSLRTLPHLEARASENLACLTELLGDKPFLLGKYVTLGDLALYAQLACVRKYHERRLLEPFEVVRAWMARLDEVREIQAALAGREVAAA